MTNQTSISPSDVLLLLCMALVCFIIGLPTYLMGCNDSVYPAGCVGYYVGTGTVAGTDIKQTVCSYCYQAGAVTVCNSYPCYEAYVRYDVCANMLGTWSIRSDAQHELNKYSIGTKETVFREKSKPSVCTNNVKRVTVDLPITGVVFLTLTGFFLIIAGIQVCMVAVAIN